MLDEAKRTIAYLCPRCRKVMVAERSLFALAAAPTDICCDCGGSAVHIELDNRKVTVTIPCAFCGNGHQGTFAAQVFRSEKFIVFYCG